jgi:hypothetical protein
VAALNPVIMVEVPPPLVVITLSVSPLKPSRIAMLVPPVKRSKAASPVPAPWVDIRIATYRVPEVTPVIVRVMFWLVFIP